MSISHFEIKLDGERYFACEADRRIVSQVVKAKHLTNACGLVATRWCLAEKPGDGGLYACAKHTPLEGYHIMAANRPGTRR